MEVKYVVAMDDFVAFNRHVFAKSSATWVSYVVGWCATPLLCLLLAAVMIPFPDAHWLALVLVVVSILAAAVYPFVYRFHIDYTIRSLATQAGTRGLLGPMRLQLTDESLAEISEAARVEVRWEQLQSIDVVGDRTYLFVSGISAVILPANGFENRNEYLAARDFAIARVGPARTKHHS